MGKARRGGKELTAIQELKYENQRLKRENDQLHKQLARIDLDKYGQLKKIIKKHYKREDTQKGNDILDKVRQEWACKEPGCCGFLEILLYTKINDTWYFRKCSDPVCKNRTKAQKYTPDVKGILKKSSNSSAG